MKNKKRFVIVVVLVLIIGGYIFISKQKLTPLASPTEITQEEAVESDASQEMEIATESIPKTEEVAPTEKKTEIAAPKEPLQIWSGYASCADGTRHNQCSATQPLICTSGKLNDDCRTCGCPNNRICATGGNCVELLFPPEVVAPYNSWAKINPALEGLGVTAVLIDEDRKIIPNEDEREKMKNSLAYIIYIFEELYQGTPIKSFLLEFKEIRLHVESGFSLTYGTLAKADMNFLQLSLLSSFLAGEGIPNTDRYMIFALHESGHVIHENLAITQPTIKERFDTICWSGDELKIDCQEREKAFVPTTMTFLKPFKDLESQKYVPLDYYALKNVNEDFAETIVAYVVSPKEFRGLAAQYPILKQKYDFMKTNIFGGKEF